MNARELFYIAEASGNITKKRLLARFPGIEDDLAVLDLNISGSTDWGAYDMRLVIEPLNKFTPMVERVWNEFLSANGETIEHMRRILRIISVIKKGEPQRPIYVLNDRDIFEGYHRIVAFYLLGLPTAPVVYVARTSSPPAVRRRGKL